MNRQARSGVVRLFSAAIIDQALLSIANLAAGFVMIRFTTDVDYGLYVLVQSALLLAISAQGAWIAGPLAVLAAKKSPADRYAVIGAVTDGQRRLLRRVMPVLLVLPVVAYLTVLHDALITWVLIGAIVAGWGALRRDHLRNVLLIYSKPETMVRADAVYAGVQLVTIGWAAFATHHAIIWATAGLAVAGWLGMSSAYRAIAVEPGWVWGDRPTAWRELRAFGFWSLVGGIAYWLFGQSYSYVLATRLDLTAVTAVNAVRLVLMPAFVLSTGMQGLLNPMAATWNAELGFRGLVVRLLAIVAIVGGIDLCYFAFIWVFRDWVIVDLLHKHIVDRDRLLLLWAGVAVIGLMRDVLQCGLVALGKFRSLASQVVVSAVVALSIMWFGTAWWGAAAVLIGQIVGELVNLAGIVWQLRSHERLNPSSAASVRGT